ncbi:ermin-like [Notechis scutatus]|uniref:Ermin n=1 Tax=Notechis scutatus TaxID=8663 RepID=A0A6J1UGW5_9SAUR|nr:ermin-like [Notechis scutatus]XP_026530269.1 ermin-like [Notechis scutatus]
MTEDSQAPTSINWDMSSEKPQLQVIDIIDQLANSSEIRPHEITEIKPGSPFIEENQEGAKHLAENSTHQISDATKELQGKPEGKNEEKNSLVYQESRVCEEESRDGLHEKIAALSTKEFQGEENAPSKLQDGNISSPTETEVEQGKIQLNETSERMKEEILLKDNESLTEEDWEGEEEDEFQQENSMASHIKGQENNNTQGLPTSPSCASQTEKYDDQPGALKKNDVSRHSYSRYNTISYRKIRKGNTKQRIDEFESMMHS